MHLILNLPSNTNFKDFIDSPFARAPLFLLFMYLFLFADRKKRVHSVLSVHYRSFVLLMKLCRCLLVSCLFRRLRRYCCKGIISYFFRTKIHSCLSSRWFIKGNWLRFSQTKILALPLGMCVFLRELCYPERLKDGNFLD